ncbi:hypothetical protein C0995_001017, partial [Termitomyces sp. Mi166
ILEFSTTVIFAAVTAIILLGTLLHLSEVAFTTVYRFIVRPARSVSTESGLLLGSSTLDDASLSSNTSNVEPIAILKLQPDDLPSKESGPSGPSVSTSIPLIFGQKLPISFINVSPSQINQIWQTSSTSLSAKSGSDWSRDELAAFNITIASQSAVEFFGRDLPNVDNVDQDLSIEIEQWPEAKNPIVRNVLCYLAMLTEYPGS